jgi:hypothetical protein
MNTKQSVVSILIVFSIGSVALADRPLDRAEILRIFEKLTSQPRKTWIPAGTIEATHEEYRAPKTTDVSEINQQIKDKIQEYQDNTNKRERTQNLQKMRLDAIPFNVRYRMSNEYTMNSTVVVKFDGERFYWEINADSRQDSVKPSPDLEGNFMTDHFDASANGRRVFVWDGEKYTMYFVSGNHVTVDTTGNIPHAVNGPLTAGIVPWGSGYCTYENLSAAESAGAEKYVDGQRQVHVTVNNPDGSEMLFVMDPQKDYALISASITGKDNSLIYRHYAGYRLVSDNWVPTTILIQRYDAGANRLLAQDLWNFTRITGDVPGLQNFVVDYEPDALVEYSSPVTDSSVVYRYSNIVDTENLLAERLAVAASEGSRRQNCGTAAMEYVVSRFGKTVTDRQLAQLIDAPSETTSLYAMKQLAEGLGLYCRSVRTNIETLKSLYGCEVILHIPGKKHFVVLGGIDNVYVWSIDLVSKKFFYRTDLNFFGMDWTEGTALVVSDRPIQIPGEFMEIADAELPSIIGGEGYSCTRLLQEFDIVRCDYVMGECLGYSEVYYTRWGCEAAESGSCAASRMLRYVARPCINDPYYPDHCTVTGDYYCFYMRACA